MNLEYLKQAYFELDIPVPFLNFKISPAKVKDYYSFHWAMDCLTLEKNKDPNGIVLSYLDYLLKKIEEETNSEFWIKLTTILEIILGVENGIYCEECGFEKHLQEVSVSLNKLSEMKNPDPEDFEKLYNKELGICQNCGGRMLDIITYGFDDKKKGYLKIKDTILKKELFEEFKQIVCYQNMPDYNDDYIDPALEAELKEVERLKNKNIIFPSLEKQMCCVVTGSSYTFENLQNLSLRKFVLLLRTIDAKLHYQIYKMNENSGAVTFKNGLDHWIYETKRTILDSIVTLDTIKEKMKHVAK